MKYTKENIIERTKQEMRRVSLSGWTVTVSNKKSLYGLADFANKNIEISLPCANQGDDEGLLETILHEIAHALCDEKVHHGQKWKDEYRRIGGNPKYRDPEISADEFYNWERRCPDGCVKYSHALRRKQNDYCAFCGKKIEYRSMRNPEKGWYAYHPRVLKGTKEWVMEETRKLGADFSGEVAIAPEGFIWRSTETHALDFGSDYYSRENYESVAEMRATIASDIESGLVECHCDGC